MFEAIIFIALGLVVGFVLGAGAATFFINKMGSQFKLTAQEAVTSAHESFLQRAEETFKKHHADGAHDLDKRQKAIDEMMKPVHENLKTLSSALEQMKGTDQALREDLKSLSQETAKLSGAMRNPAAQGRWGEYILERLLQNAHLQRDVHYKLQTTMQTDSGNVLRPDAVIFLQDGFNIIVDAKAPISEFVDQSEEIRDEATQKQLNQNLAQKLRKHIKDLSSKAYWDQLDSPDFVVLFLPSEHIFSTALSADPGLVDFAAENKIVVASPTLMLSLLRVVGLSWRQVELAKNAQEISKQGGVLYERIASFAGEIDKVGKNMGAALGAYNKAVSMMDNSLISAAKKLKDMHVTTREDVEQPRLLEALPRDVQLSEQETEKKRA